jgi:hypothetical protein
MQCSKDGAEMQNSSVCVHPSLKQGLKSLQAMESAGLKQQHAYFASVNIIHLDTVNFNETIRRESTRKSILVLFYDPDGPGFEPYTKHVDELAHALDGPDSPGLLGVVDASLHNFLAYAEAQTQMVRNAASNMIVYDRKKIFQSAAVLYHNGIRQEEYRGTLDSSQVIPYLLRHNAEMVVNLKDANSIQDYFYGSVAGPRVLGCGLQEESQELSTFESVARTLHGQAMFGLGNGAACSALLKKLFIISYSDASPNLKPVILWARNLGAGKDVMSNVTVMRDTPLLKEWLQQHRPELVQYTNANEDFVIGKGTHAYSLLGLFLIHSNNASDLALSQALSDSLPAKTHEKIKVAWAECGDFSNDHSLIPDCPSVVLKDTNTAEYMKLPLDVIYNSKYADHPGEPWTASRLFPHERLDVFFRFFSTQWKPDTWREKEQEKSPNDEPAPEEEDPNNPKCTGRCQFLNTSDPTPWPSLIMPDPQVSKTTSVWHLTNTLISFLYELKNSARITYGDVIDEFEWEILEEITKDPRLAVFAHSPDDIPKMVADKKSKSDLNERFHWRAEYMDELAQIEDMLEAITEGKLVSPSKFEARRIDKAHQFRASLFNTYGKLEIFYSRLIDFLHKKDEDGLLGPPRSPIQVDVRQATELSVREFIDKYARPGVPVIIRGINLTKSP